MATILVTDGEQRAALAAVRSLGRAGHRVIVASHLRRPLAAASRYAHSTVITPEPLAQPEEFTRTVREHVHRFEVEVLLPVTDAALLALLPERHRITAIMPFPAYDAFTRLCDKAAVANEAAALGIHVPRTVRIDGPGEHSALSAAHLPFPLVLKATRSVTIGNGKRTKPAIRHLPDVGALGRALRELPEQAYPVLLQERIEGPGIGVFVGLRGGEPYAAFGHRRIREKPPWGGVSVYRESVPLDPELLERSVALLRRFDFEGVAMVEFKIDQRTRTPTIIEINGRFWGSLQLAIDAGVDFPALLVAAVLGLPSTPVVSYRAGVRSRWFWGDVDHLLLRLRDPEPGQTSVWSRAQACFDFIRACGPGSRNEVLRLTDPRPAIRETLAWVRGQAG